MKSSIVQRFLKAYIFLILTAVMLLGFFVNSELKEHYRKSLTDELAKNAFLIGRILKGDIVSENMPRLQAETEGLSEDLGFRITVIAGSGKVLADSQTDPSAMEDHSGREEVVEAMSGGIGESSRLSDTLDLNMKYVAVSVKNNGYISAIVRTAVPLTNIENELSLINRFFIFGGILAIIVTLVIGLFISRRITLPIKKMGETAQSIANGDFSKRVEVGADDELGALARSFNRMADELEKEMEKLKKMDRIRTDFVANVSHELKTPLTSIKGFIETLEDGAIDDKDNARRFLSIIKKHAERLGSIINDILSLTEIENGAVDMGSSAVDVKALLDETVWGFSHAVSMKEQKLEVDYKGSDFEVRGNREKIEQVLVNLVDNAIKYTGKGGKISAVLFGKKDSVMLVVEDNGIGIEKEHLDRIFERFYRADKARSRESGGTGLGLSIVKHIVSLHGGEIDIESEPSKGTKVTVIFLK